MRLTHFMAGVTAFLMLAAAGGGVYAQHVAKDAPADAPPETAQTGPETTEPTRAATPAPTLTPEQRLRAEVLRLQIENAQLKQRVGQLELELSGVAATRMEAEFLKVANAPPGSTWDWVAMRPILPPAKTTPAKP